MDINTLRQKFLDYFISKNHQYFTSSNLIIKNDPTLMFTNAGMNQFKNIFLGLENTDINKATSAQKCLRAGGKHNDLENVGFTSRHHTFFEMLGNFSFGSYFKKEAIFYAWDFLTNTLNINKDKLYISVYKDDDEAFNIWHNEIGIEKERIFKFGDKDNFWSMGDVGPCGPCSEIFYDHNTPCSNPACSVGCSCDRYVEIWNLVFMQYEKDSSGNLKQLPKPSIDTGCGLERLAAVMKGVVSNYDIDLFIELKKEINKEAKYTYLNPEYASYFNAIADHLRAIAFLISENCIPSNEGANYVLRRIIRRAVRSGKKIGFNAPFLYKKIAKLIELMGKHYTNLVEKKDFIIKVLKAEEESFYITLDRGLILLEEEVLKTSSNIFSGSIAFKLHDTYGFPLDLTKLILKEKNINIDEDAFNKEMLAQKEKAKKNKISLSSILNNVDILISKLNVNETNFIGYSKYENLSTLTHIISLEGNLLEIAKKDMEVIFIFDSTVFYAESGGQIADSGFIYKTESKASVQDVYKTNNSVYIHKVKILNGEFKINNSYNLNIDAEKRKLISRNHTATHLLHYALRKFLGSNLKQAGSFVTDSFFRFDFNHNEKINLNTLNEIELFINKLIVEESIVEIKYVNYEDAIKDKAIALFDEKYGKTVRLVKVGNYSKELCGGTHVSNISEIGIFKIISESSTGSGVRRIEAKTSLGAYNEFNNYFNIINEVVNTHKISKEEILVKINALIEDNKNVRKEINKLIVENNSATLKALAIELETNSYLIKRVSIDLKANFKSISEDLKNKINKGVLVIYSDINIPFCMVISKEKKLDAGLLIKYINSLIKSKGGGSNILAQSSNFDIALFESSIKEINNFIKERLGV